MSLIPLSEGDLLGNRELLPIEEEKEVNGRLKMIPINYVAEVTSTKEIESKQKHTPGMEIVLSIFYNGKRVDVKDNFWYSKDAAWRLGVLAKITGLDIKKPIDTEDFLGHMLIVNVKHETYTSTKMDENTGEYPEITNNKINNYVRLATPEEQKVVVDSLNTGFAGVDPVF